MTLLSTIAQSIAVQNDDNALETLLDQMTPEQVKEFAVGVEKIRSAAVRARSMAYLRLITIMGVGEVYKDPWGGEWLYGGDRERVCDDPARLKSELEQVALSPVARIALKEAFKDQPMKVYLTHLDRIEKFGGEEAGRVIRAHLSWKEGSPKLRPLDEGKR